MSEVCRLAFFLKLYPSWCMHMQPIIRGHRGVTTIVSIHICISALSMIGTYVLGPSKNYVKKGSNNPRAYHNLSQHLIHNNFTGRG